MAQNLEDRLLAFAVAAGNATDTMPRTIRGLEIAHQLVRSSMGPVGNYAEARSAVSDKEYLFKVKLCLKELRESRGWIRLAAGSGFTNADYEWLEAECNELISIFVACVKKVEKRLEDEKTRGRSRRQKSGENEDAEDSFDEPASEA